MNEERKRILKILDPKTKLTNPENQKKQEKIKKLIIKKHIKGMKKNDATR